MSFMATVGGTGAVRSLQFYVKFLVCERSEFRE
jgi:hypothetical protein